MRHITDESAGHAIFSQLPTRGIEASLEYKVHVQYSIFRHTPPSVLIQ